MNEIERAIFIKIAEELEKNNLMMDSLIGVLEEIQQVLDRKI